MQSLNISPNKERDTPILPIESFSRKSKINSEFSLKAFKQKKAILFRGKKIGGSSQIV